MCEDSVRIEIHWYSIWLRTQSCMTSHYAWRPGTTLHDFGSVMGWSILLGSHGRGSWHTTLEEFLKYTSNYKEKFFKKKPNKFIFNLKNQNKPNKPKKKSTCDRLDLETLSNVLDVGMSFIKWSLMLIRSIKWYCGWGSGFQNVIPRVLGSYGL